MPPSSFGFFSSFTSGIGAPFTAASVNVYASLMSSGPVMPSGTLSTFVTGIFAVVGFTPYVFVNVTLPAVAVRVPSPLSLTVTVTVLLAGVSFATPSTVPLSVTV